MPDSKKIQPSALESALALVAPFVGTYIARSSILHPFHAGLWGRPYVAATDGHTAAMVHCPEASTVSVPRPVGAAPPPSLAAVVPTNAERVGSFLASELESLRGFPKAWEATIDFTPHELPRLNLTRVKGSGRNEKRIEIVRGAALHFKYELEVSTAFRVEYLLRAIDFCGAERVTVWRERGGKLSDQNPVIFTCGAGSYAGETDHVALVMACKK